MRLIVIEGNDFSGKTETAQVLAEHFQLKGAKAYYTREPGGCKVAEQLRQVVLNTPMSIMSQAMLFCAARLEHLNNVVIPRLDQGVSVICDRFITSSYVYQGIPEVIPILNFLHGEIFIPPFIQVLLDVPYEVALERAKASGRQLNLLDSLDETIFNTRRERYKHFALHTPVSQVSHSLTLEVTREMSTQDVVDAITDLLKEQDLRFWN